MRDTRALIRPVTETTAALFYGRLFDLNPDIEALDWTLDAVLGDDYTREARNAWGQSISGSSH